MIEYEAERDRAKSQLGAGDLTERECQRRLELIDRSEMRAIRKTNLALAKADAKRYAEKVKRVSGKMLRRALHRSLSRYEEPDVNPRNA